MQINIYCQNCGEIMEYVGIMTLQFQEEDLPKNNSQNDLGIEFNVFKCLSCGYKQCFELDVDAPEEYMQPPNKIHLKLYMADEY